MDTRERILGLFARKEVDRVACFTGMGTVWGVALKHYGYKFAHIHSDAQKMIRVASYPAQAFGYECAVVPFDLCIETEILGSDINYYIDNERPLYPKPRRPIIESLEEMEQLELPLEIKGAGRLPLVIEAIQTLKKTVGRTVPVGSFVLGPYTLAGQIIDFNKLLRFTIKNPAQLDSLLTKLTGLIIKVAREYEKAGVDYITVREMSGTTDIVPPPFFQNIIVPHLQRIFANLNCVGIIHICGGTMPVLKEMLTCGAAAVSVENKNSLGETRKIVGDNTILLGNLDGFELLGSGTPDDIVSGVKQCLEEGSDGLWPACEVSLDAPAENLAAMINTVKEYGSKLWFRKNE